MGGGKRNLYWVGLNWEFPVRCGGAVDLSVRCVRVCVCARALSLVGTKNKVQRIVCCVVALSCLWRHAVGARSGGAFRTPWPSLRYWLHATSFLPRERVQRAGPRLRCLILEARDVFCASTIRITPYLTVAMRVVTAFGHQPEPVVPAIPLPRVF